MTPALTTKGSATRARIIEGAAALIRREGVEQTGLDDIRAETATSKSQLFHYFPGGRSDLLYAVAVHEADQVITEQQPYLDALGPAESWPAWRDTVIRKYREQGRECPLSALTTGLGPTDPRIRPLVASLLEDWHGRIADGVRRHPVPLIADDLAAAILAAIQGGVMLMLSTGKISYLETALTTALLPLHQTPSNSGINKPEVRPLP